MVTLQTTEIGVPEMTLMRLRYTIRSLDSMKNLKATLENSLREVETCYAMQMEKLSRILLQLESELANTRTGEQLSTRIIRPC